ncbi:PAS domain S-box protein [Nodularia sp. LEGE 06071]|nr:PAS domain S-box protein [Nodularia sp. LEGE 06071]MCC2691290.1 PAS domain S-box protein [Nodularia sp. LEGE 04288]
MTGYNQAEIGLSGTEAHLQQALEYVPVAIAIFDLEMRYLSVSRKWLEEYHLSDGIIGRSHYEVFPDIPAESKQIHQKCLAGAIEQGHEEPYPRANGSIEWVSSSLRPWHTASGDIGGMIIFSENVTQRKQSEIALRHSEERYQSLVSTTSQIVWTVPPDGIFINDNPSWRAFTGQTWEECQGWGWLEAIHPEDQQLIAQAWETSINTLRPYQIECRLRRHDGEYRYMLERAVPVLETDGSVREWVGTCTDIHERKQAEFNLVEQNALLQSILECTPDLIMAKDLEGRYVALNSNVAKFLGKSIEQIIGKDDSELFPPEVAPGIMEKDRQVISTGISQTYEEDVSDGHTSTTFITAKSPWLNFDGQIIGLIITVRNITDRKQAEIALQQSEQRYSSLIKAISQIIWTADSEGRVTNLMDLLNYCGTTETAMAGLGWLELIHPEDREPTSQIWMQAVETKTLYESECRLQSVDGDYRYFHNRAVPILNSDGMIQEWVGICTDITARKEAQQTLNAAKEAAEAASYAKSEFLANMSHELRTPLNGILGYAQILQRSQNLDAEQRSRIDIIYQCGSHLLTLINDILDLSKIEAQKVELMPTDFHFPAFLQGVAEMCRIRAQIKNIQFHYQLAADLPIGIRADEKRLRQVLINLVSNAIKFTDVGSVTFSISYTREGKIRFQVRDTGIGIVPEKLQIIFQPFEQAGNSRRHIEGTGLGLAISKKIVEFMGSTIEVHSEVNVGSIFQFDVNLPVADEWVKTSQADNYGQIIGIKDRKPKVLVVDDKWENRSVIAHLLSPLGFEVAEATNGQEGWLKILEFQPDLIITDLLMPELDGFQLIKRIRESKPLKNIVIIVSSASVFETDQHRSLEVGGNEFIAKPVQAIELFQKLQKHLHLEWLYEKQERVNQPELESSDVELVPPPTAEMEILYELAMKGNFRGINKQAGLIAEMDERYLPFAQKLQKLARDFQDQEILALIQSYQ